MQTIKWSLYVVILWVSWCKNKSFWQRFTCTWFAYGIRLEWFLGHCIFYFVQGSSSCLLFLIFIQKTNFWLLNLKFFSLLHSDILNITIWKIDWFFRKFLTLLFAQFWLKFTILTLIAIFKISDHSFSKLLEHWIKLSFFEASVPLFGGIPQNLADFAPLAEVIFYLFIKKNAESPITELDLFKQQVKVE